MERHLKSRTVPATVTSSVSQRLSVSSVMSGVHYQHLVAGLTAGVASTLVMHPFDLIKLRFAVHDGSLLSPRQKYRGLVHAVTTITKQEGILGLYRGASANVTGAGLSWGFYFFFYNALKSGMQRGDANLQLSPLAHLLMATCAGMVTLSLTNPVWVVKTRLCLTNTAGTPSYMQYRGVLDGLAKLYTHEGIRGFYKGFIPGLFGTSHGAVQFMVYEEMKKFYCNYYSVPITTKLGPLEYVAMAGVSKIVAASVTYPYQVIRARLQDQEQKYTGVIDTIRRTWRYEGYRGFYKGLTVNLTKVVPATCITFVIYEYLSQSLLQFR